VDEGSTDCHLSDRREVQLLLKMPLEGVFGIELLERDAWREWFEAADFRVHHGGAVLLRPVRGRSLLQLLA
jgi:hypothetical protein